MSTNQLMLAASIDLHLRLPGIIALVAGILIFIFPRLLNYLVGGYLIIVGVIQVFNLHL